METPILKMKLIHSVVIAVATATRLVQWIKSSAVPSRLSMTRQLILKEIKTVQSLMADSKFTAIFLPSDAAWSRHHREYQALSKGGVTTQDFLMEGALEVPRQGGIHSLLRFARSNENVVYSTLGSGYYFVDGRTACLARLNRKYQYEADRTRCVRFALLDVDLRDADVFVIDDVVFSDNLEDQLKR